MGKEPADISPRLPRASRVARTADPRRSQAPTPAHMSGLTRLVRRMRGFRKTRRPPKRSAPRPALRDYEPGSQEVAWVVSESRRLHENGTPYEDMAVLFRINGRSEDYEEA